MLVLTRKAGEAIRIGDNITVTLLEIKGNQVRIGIDAPNSVMVHRHEVYEKVMRENRLASHVSLEAFTKLKEVMKGK